ncbi:MAG: TonB-dependent receptor plug domain-containing protein [Bryobacterales bacterium]|nr:TonB-dependent receptor plug domain-containing protein [Bryobacterales bacterium]
MPPRLRTQNSLPHLSRQEPVISHRWTSINSCRRRSLPSGVRKSLGRAAGAVYVITQKELRRSGVTSIPEVLRLVPGVLGTTGRIILSTWAISARGFNNVYANKLLVMIDGRSVYSPVVGGVFWDSQDTLIEDIDRIQVLRGPGAAMWGANAVNGVINIITKPAVRTQGTLVTFGSGTEDEAVIGVRQGIVAGSQGYFRIYGQEKLRTGAAAADPRFGDSRWSMTQAGFRGDWTLRESDALTVQGDVYRSGARSYDFIKTLTPPFGSMEPDRAETWGGNLNARWEHSHRDGGLSVIQTYFDSVQKDSALINVGVQTGDAEYQYRRPAIRRHELSIGLRAWTIADQYQGSKFINVAPADERYGMQHVTLEDDYGVVLDRLTLSVAARFEHNSFYRVDGSADAPFALYA